MTTLLTVMCTLWCLLSVCLADDPRWRIAYAIGLLAGGISCGMAFARWAQSVAP